MTVAVGVTQVARHVANSTTATPSAPSPAPTVDFNADSLTLADGDPVSTFPDDSGNGHVATNLYGLAAFKVGVVSGHDAVRCTGGIPDWGDLSALFPTAATFMCLVTVNGTQYSLMHTGVADEFWRHGSGGGYNGTFRAAREDNYPAGMPTSGTHLFTLRHSATKFELRMDGVSMGAGTPSYTPGTGHSIGYGACPFAGDLSRALLFNSALSDAQCAAWEAYIA